MSALIILFASFCHAAVINVPTDVESIQGGIDLANPGDTVLVYPGTYYENINFKGKAITVASLFILEGKKFYIANTIINGSKPSHPDSGSVVYFINGENTTSVLCGFTITYGTGTIYTEPGVGRSGGGIHGVKAGATVINNIIENNHINYYDMAIGGGIYFWRVDNNDLIIENNIIRNNTVYSEISSLYSLGAGIYTNGWGNETIRIANNLIADNVISAPFAWGGGIVPSNWGNVKYMIVNNIISGNKVKASIWGGSGGIDVFNHYPVIRNNVITNNSAPYGAGMAIEFYPPVDNNAGISVASETTAGPRGPDAPKLKDKTLHKFTSDHIANLSNNTLTGNTSVVFGGGVAVFGVVPELMNFILWGNRAPDSPQIFGNPDIQYSDVQGGYPGTGNIDKNPRFISPLYFLGIQSPCIDAGNPALAYNDPESVFLPGHAQLPARGTLRNDMGAYGGPDAAGWRKSTNFAKELETLKFEEKKTFAENREKRLNISQFPNPFNSQTTISFELPKDDFVSLKIFNVLGQEVANLVTGKLKAGIHRYTWNANNVASGVYLYRLQTNGLIYQKRLILIK